MRKLAACLLAFVASLAFASSVQIKTTLRPQTQLTAFDYVAWGICSFIWNGKEFLDCYDHGRGLSTAVVYDQMGEAENPTEQGADADGPTPNPSSSQVLSMSADGTSITSQVHAAYWHPYNGLIVSNTVIGKTSTIGLGPNGRTVQVDVSFTLPADETHSQAQFEVLTGYMPPKYSHFRTYDPVTRTLAEVTDGPGEQALPLVFCTTDDKYCMGVISSTPLTAGGYGRWRFGTSGALVCRTKQGVTGCVKWNAVTRVDYPAPGTTFNYRIRVTAGILADVTAGMDWAWANP
jgi:hypothetical protein